MRDDERKLELGLHVEVPEDLCTREASKRDLLRCCVREEERMEATDAM